MDDTLMKSYCEAIGKLTRQNTEFFFDQMSLENCIMNIRNEAVTDVDIHTVNDDETEEDRELVKVCMKMKHMKNTKTITFKQFKYFMVKMILKDYCEHHGINVYHN